MKLQQHIEISVDNEFNTTYERNLVKVYLYYWLLRNHEENRQYHNYEIAGMLCITPKMVSRNLKRLEKESNLNLECGYNRKDPFLSKDFERKFDNVEKACAGYAEIVNIQTHREAQERAYMHLLNARELNIEYYLN